EEGMSPIEAALKGSKEIFFAVISISITLASVFLPVIFLEGFVGRLFREFGVVIASAVLVSAFVSLTLTPMLNAYLIKGGGHKKTRFYEWTEPMFVKMNKGYANSLDKFMKFKWISFPILLICFVIIAVIFSSIKKETAPYDDRSAIMVNVTGPEGATYEYMDRYMQELDKLVYDSIPENKISLNITSPGFGASSVNSGRIRMTLVDPEERTRSQDDVAKELTKWTKKYDGVRVNVSQTPTISMNRRGGLPVQYIIQAQNFEKLQEKIPEFMNEVNNDPTFSTTDINLKFNKPELHVEIDRLKALSMGVSVLDVSQSLQLLLSGQRFAYFMRDGKQYQVIGQVDNNRRATPTDLTSIYVRNNIGQLIQLDNVVNVKEESSPPQLY
ncbi:MAG: efflux RND transporter permease subunit, partial [Sphingobacterium sp.]